MAVADMGIPMRDMGSFWIKEEIKKQKKLYSNLQNAARFHNIKGVSELIVLRGRYITQLEFLLKTIKNTSMPTEICNDVND